MCNAGHACYKTYMLQDQVEAAPMLHRTSMQQDKHAKGLVSYRIRRKSCTHAIQDMQALGHACYRTSVQQDEHAAGYACGETCMQQQARPAVCAPPQLCVSACKIAQKVRLSIKR